MCHAPGCHWFLRQLVERHDLAEHWNAMLRDAAKADPRLQVVSIDSVFCKDTKVPCDDSFGDGLARPDGAHFSATAAPVVARALLDLVARTR
ncbi:MAG: hypothetical protein BGO98_25440 [Myxococcales bacterium 68-20]|mgnify:FL=1|nr:hypothetical protein [Myxococcales bacterium]OJY15995.1 MAG: hypothetical protein BGO98_25440 [Myxococcales bacterium 68-20]